MVYQSDLPFSKSLSTKIAFLRVQKCLIGEKENWFPFSNLSGLILSQYQTHVGKLQGQSSSNPIGRSPTLQITKGRLSI
uniref:Putative ovule protein n=1 Tax=Solanum chacoense TaxID=4108 RepID=A0A0V0HG00_SOLCH